MAVESVAAAKRCSYAPPGTYGHECGRPGVFVGLKPSEHTRSGTYFAVRCAECRDLTGRDNWGIKEWRPFDPSVHINEFR